MGDRDESGHGMSDCLHMMLEFFMDSPIGEWARIISFALPPTFMFLILGAVLQLSVERSYSPLIVLGMLCILSCCMFNEDGPEGFFSPPTSSPDKGLRFLCVKGLELIAESLGCYISDLYTLRHVPEVQKHATMEHYLAMYSYVLCMSIMTISFVRSAIIFPMTIVTMVRIAGRSTAWSPFDRFH